MKTLRFLVPATLVLGAALAACGGSSSAEQDDATQGAASPTAHATRPAASATPASVNTAAAQPSPTPPAPTATPATGHAPSAQPTSPPPPPPLPAATSTPVPLPPAQGQFLVIAAQDTQFVPSQLSAQNGATITVQFDNQDAGVAHDLIVYTPAGGIAGQSPVIVGPAQATFSLTPTSAGAYFFKCSLHPVFMTGRITVAP